MKPANDDKIPAEQIAENLANRVYGEGNQTVHWQAVKDAFILGYIECLNNWKWEDGKRDNQS